LVTSKNPQKLIERSYKKSLILYGYLAELTLEFVMMHKIHIAPF